MSGYIGIRKVPTPLDGGGIWRVNEQAKFEKDGIWPVNSFITFDSYASLAAGSQSIVVDSRKIAIVVDPYGNTTGAGTKLYTPLPGYSPSGVYALSVGTHTVSIGVYGGIVLFYISATANTFSANVTGSVDSNGTCLGTGSSGANLLLATGQVSGTPIVDFSGVTENSYAYGTYFRLTHAINTGFGDVSYTTSDGSYLSSYSTVTQINVS